MSAPVQDMPRGLWSLWDMINYQMFGLVGWLGLLEQERRVSAFKAEKLLAVNKLSDEEAAQVPRPSYLMTDQDWTRIKGLLDFAGHICSQLALIRTEDRIVRFRQAMAANPISPVAAHQELNTLYQSLEDDLKLKYFYFYPDDKAQRLLKVDAEWAAAFGSFASITDDAKAAADCYALSHHNACVFSCMLALEVGLRALASDVGAPFKSQNWKNVIDQIEAKIGEMRSHGIPGLDKAAKDARLQFLSEAAKEFSYFKDAWRNYVAHGHARYDEHQALGVYEHTKAFMNLLASRLSEAP